MDDTAEFDGSIVKAPWDYITRAALKVWQTTGSVHPYTSHDGISLEVTDDGFVCPCGCGFAQDWCFAVSLEPMPPSIFETIAAMKAEKNAL